MVGHCTGRCFYTYSLHALYKHAKMINFCDINVYCYDDSVGTVMAYCTPVVYCDFKKKNECVNY